MEPQNKSGSMFGTILVVIIIVGLVIYYLSTKNERMERQNDGSSLESANTTNQDHSTSSGAELETEVEAFDSEFSDMNSEDLDM